MSIMVSKMCMAFQAKVVSAENNSAIVDFQGGRREVLFKGLDVKEGDSVLVQFGMIIEILA